MRVIYRLPVNSPHKGPVTWKMLPFDDVVISLLDGCKATWMLRNMHALCDFIFITESAWWLLIVWWLVISGVRQRNVYWQVHWNRDSRDSEVYHFWLKSLDRIPADQVKLCIAIVRNISISYWKFCEIWGKWSKNLHVSIALKRFLFFTFPFSLIQIVYIL